MANMLTYRTNQTLIPSFVLQARDWETVVDFIAREESYDELIYELRGLFRVNPAPVNQQNVAVSSLTVSMLTALFERFYFAELSISDATRSRLRDAITTASVSMPVLASMMIDKDGEVDSIKQAESAAARARGRKRLRKSG